MHKYKILFFSLTLLLFACGGRSIPKDVIQPDRMTALLTEMHIADGSMYNVMQLPDSLYKYGTDRYLIVFKRFQTDSVQFKKSMRYYTSDPELLTKIYDQITTNLKQKSDSLNKVNQAQVAKENKRRQDSLQKLPKQLQPQTPPVQNPAPHPPVPSIDRRYMPIRPKPNAHPIK